MFLMFAERNDGTSITFYVKWKESFLEMLKMIQYILIKVYFRRRKKSPFQKKLEYKNQKSNFSTYKMV